MTALREFQRGFAAALTDGADLAPGDFAAGGVPLARAQAIYRNNVAAKLVDALGALYPVVERLTGRDFFRHAAGLFARRNPPASPVLAEYGDRFPDFLETFEPAGSVPYLADVARVELARHRALNAADARPVDVAALAAIDPDRFPGLRFRPHPSLRAVASPYAVEAVWRAHQDAAEPGPGLDPLAGPTRLLVARPEIEVRMLPLSVAAYDFALSLVAGERLDDAFAARSGDWDARALLARLLTFGAFAEFDLLEETR